MAIGQKVYKLAQTAIQNRDKIYAGLTGTATGIGTSPQASELWRRYVDKSNWRDPYKTRRGKAGDAFINESDNQQESPMLTKNTLFLFA